jgi:hypothetical protein
MLREVSVIRMRWTLASSSIFFAGSISSREWLGLFRRDHRQAGSAERG